MVNQEDRAPEITEETMIVTLDDPQSVASTYACFSRLSFPFLFPQTSSPYSMTIRRLVLYREKEKRQSKSSVVLGRRSGMVAQEGRRLCIYMHKRAAKQAVV